MIQRGAVAVTLHLVANWRAAVIKGEALWVLIHPAHSKAADSCSVHVDAGTAKELAACQRHCRSKAIISMCVPPCR